MNIAVFRFVQVCLLIVVIVPFLRENPAHGQQESKPRFWTKAKSDEMFRRKYDPSCWNMEMFQDDMEHHLKHRPSIKPPSSNFPSPVPKYSKFGGAITWPSFEISKKMIRGVMFSWGKCDVNRHLASDPSHTSICYLNLFILTDAAENEKALAMTSRNYPHVLSTGKQKTSVGDVDWVHVGMADGNNLVIINQRIFDLKYGKTVLVAPQKDGSLRFKQLKAPASFDSKNSEFRDNFLKELKSNEDVVSFFTTANTIGPASPEPKPTCQLPKVRDEFDSHCLQRLTTSSVGSLPLRLETGRLAPFR